MKYSSVYMDIPWMVFYAIQLIVMKILELLEDHWYLVKVAVLSEVCAVNPISHGHWGVVARWIIMDSVI